MEKEKPLREKLLAAASEAFVRKGFHRATIAGICERIKTNINTSTDWKPIGRTLA